MDEEFKKLQYAAQGDSDSTALKIDPAHGIVIIGQGADAVPYPLKPLTQLYGPGLNRPTIDPQDEAYAPLLHAIESEMVRHDNAQTRLTDGDLTIALSLLSMSPEADVHPNILAHKIQFDLRLLLSLTDYSRQDVKQAIRRIARSVQTHTEHAGRRGYLDFIREYVKG